MEICNRQNIMHTGLKMHISTDIFNTPQKDLKKVKTKRNKLNIIREMIKEVITKRNPILREPIEPLPPFLGSYNIYNQQNVE